MENIEQKGRYDKSCLMGLAIFTMLMDHIAYIFLGNSSHTFIYTLMRLIGRLAFPIYAFFISRGYFQTKNFKAYLFRLTVAAFLTEVIFDLALFGTFFHPAYQNVLFTFVEALLMIYLIENSHNQFLQIFYPVFFYYLSGVIKADYGFMGILLVFGFYFAEVYKKREFFFGLFDFYGEIFSKIVSFFFVFYSGKKGRDRKILNYLFYPGHLLILYLIKSYII